MATATAAAATTAKGAECRAQLLASLKRVYEVDWGSPALGDVGIVLSGGVDTCAMMEALRELGLMPKTAFTVFCDASATDRPYAGAIAKAFGVGQHHQIDTTKEELLRAPLALGVSALVRDFDAAHVGWIGVWKHWSANQTETETESETETYRAPNSPKQRDRSTRWSYETPL